MVEIGAAAAAALQNAAIPAAAPPAPKAASPEAVQQLESLMQQPQPTPEAASPEIAPVDATAAPATPGDAILRGLERLSHGFDSQMEQIGSLAATPGGGPMSAADMMKLQFALTQVTVQQDVTAKAVGKATSDLDTFLKNQ